MIKPLITTLIFPLLFLSCNKDSSSLSKSISGKWKFTDWRFDEGTWIGNDTISDPYPAVSVAIGKYNNDTFSISFTANGNFTFVYPSTISLNLPHTWQTASGSYHIITDSSMIISPNNSPLFGWLYYFHYPNFIVDHYPLYDTVTFRRISDAELSLNLQWFFTQPVDIGASYDAVTIRGEGIYTLKRQ
ncbi:hypothetical protein FRZ67_05375 [Panacibacter ginsenosidivorans]|uniref:Lipocalin-like domain-containing protein n=1 Tax=Panacibacter ginsenosidivorans TaxID=1813871 RepID=A0A5B8V7J2_9BACT|nr:hypothetical protein [Panacibacter ginsenosidivorans]QEC66761.1 hypothetical protein FRZ67_05375 [Panacibacter ginsenosidivorans]